MITVGGRRNHCFSLRSQTVLYETSYASREIMSNFVLLLLGLLTVGIVTAIVESEQTTAFWRQNAQEYIRSKLAAAAQPNRNRARNVILLLGDGMSLQTIAAARMYLGGEEVSLPFEQWPHFGMARTYSVDRQVSDSANTATAYLHGVKVRSDDGCVKLFSTLSNHTFT